MSTTPEGEVPTPVPCPICDTEPVVSSKSIRHIDYRWKVACDGDVDHEASIFASTEEAAIALWNRMWSNSGVRS
jgi:hypothetical protein